MHSTFVSLYLNMRRLSLSLRPHSASLGFWLATLSLASSCLAFMFSLLTAWYLEISVNPVLLGEALPFLVITVGFEKPFLLTRAVFSNPAIGPGGAYAGTTSRGSMTPVNGKTNGHANDANSLFGLRFAPPIPSRDIVLGAVSKTGVSIVRDYAIEVAVLVFGAMSGVAGLREFCQLAAVILVFDGLFLMGFFVSVLTIMVEVSGDVSRTERSLLTLTCPGVPDPPNQGRSSFPSHRFFGRPVSPARRSEPVPRR